MYYQFKKNIIRKMPFFLALFFILLKSLSFDVFGFSQSYLSNLWGVIFYFAIFNAKVLNIITVFFLGVFADFLLSIPFGLSPFIYCTLYLIVQLNRNQLIHLSFKKQWIVYIIITGLLFVVGLLLLKVMYGHIPHFIYLLTEYVLLIICYPFIATICGYVNRLIGKYEA